MAEELSVSLSTEKQELYEDLIPQIESLILDEEDMVANMANVTAALKQTFNFLWIGFYLVKKGELVLGPFQGPIACTRINFGKGVCGKAWEQKETIIVDDVDQFPGHITCSSLSKSEIVVPVFKDDEVVMVLDIDSDQFENFDQTDADWLQKIIRMLEEKL